MLYVGIDVSKDKHDIAIVKEDGSLAQKLFMVKNSLDGFNKLVQAILSHEQNKSAVCIGLEATGHYSDNILSYLAEQEFPRIHLINPLHTNIYRKALSLRKTKNDRIDAKAIAGLLRSGMELPSYTTQSYHINELKSLTRYRADKVSERSKLKISIARLVNITFPELEQIAGDLHSVSIHSLLQKYPTAEAIASARPSSLRKFINGGIINRNPNFIKQLQTLARNTIGRSSAAIALEMRHTIELCNSLDANIAEIEREITRIVNEVQPKMLEIPGINIITAATILAEVKDFNNFSSPDKILAFAGMSPTTYQSGHLLGNRARMEKRGSRYLRTALFTAAKMVCVWDDTFKNYMKKKRDEGKHYYVAISHAAKKLIRLIYHLELNKEHYIPQVAS